jgi:membrane protease YdiL (CAAX protease family)
MKITSRWLSFLLFSVVAFLALPLLAQTNDPAVSAEGTSTGSAFENLQYLVPLIAPILVMLLKKIPGWFETKFSSRLLPYVCVGIAFLLMLVLDLMGKLTIPIWIAGPIAGAIGIGSRELLDNGLKLLGLVQPTVPPAAKP